jgi:hypothetical protein
LVYLARIVLGHLETTRIEEKQKIKKNPLRGVLKAGIAPAFVSVQ